jgi:hypothetical protein
MMGFMEVRNIVKKKEEGLRQFQSRGFIIVDALYDPVNNLPDSLNPDKRALLILVKSNLCRLMERRLNHDGSKVANAGVVIPFPGSRRQREFREKLARPGDVAGEGF